MSDSGGFDMAGLVGILIVAAVLTIVFIVVAPLLLNVLTQIVPTVLILLFVFWVLRGMVKKLLG